MFVKRLLKKTGPDLAVSSGNLKASQLNVQVAVHHGIPVTASILAYEPVQRVLAVASSDGRIKIMGAVGVEGLFQSPTHFRCKYLEFLNNRGLLIHINTQNDIEVWDVRKSELAYFQKWETEIASFNVLQGSPFMFIGDHSGSVVVLEYVDHEHELNTMPYVIPPHVTLGGLVRSGSSDAPPVVGILPQPDVFFTRLLVAYGNGLIILWGLHELEVLAVRGGTDSHRLQISNYAASLKGHALSANPKPEEDEEEDKEICCVCWACPVGSVLAVGYTDGEIFLWSFPTIVKGKGQIEPIFLEGPVFCGEPVHRVDLAPGKTKMPVVGLIWGPGAKSNSGVSGRLYVFGGRDVAQPEVVTVLSLDALNGQVRGAKLLQWELDLQGPFADMALLPPPGGSSSTPAAALVLLMTPGLLQIFDELSIANYFAALAEGMPSPPFPHPVPLQLPVTETKVTCAKLVLVSNDGMAAKVLRQLSQAKRSLVPSTLPAGTRWPISGGALSTTASGWGGEANLYITGHEDGLVKIWDLCSPSYTLLCTVEKENQLAVGDKNWVSAIDICPSAGLLAVGDANGMVFLHRLKKETCEVHYYIVGLDASKAEEVRNCGPGFVCYLTLNVHKAPITTICLASGLSIAVGDQSGMVSLLDLQSQRVTFYDHCFPSHPSPIVSLAFSSESMTDGGTKAVQSPHAPSYLKPVTANMPVSHEIILYVVGEDSSIVTIDATMGVLCSSGAVQPKHSSTAVSVHLLDAGGAPLKPLNIQLGGLLETGSIEYGVDVSSGSTSSVPEEPSNDTPHDGQSIDSSTFAEALYLLLCCTDSLCLYASSSVIQGQCSPLRKVKLQKICHWTSAFSVNGAKESALLLMHSTGDLEFRSLPDLGLLLETSLSLSLNWKFEPSMDCQKTMACNNNGQVVMIDQNKELIHLFVLEDDRIRRQISQAQLFDRDLAKAAHAAVTYAGDVPIKKSIASIQGMPQAAMQGMQGLLGGVLKEIRNVLDIEQAYSIHSASELSSLFASCPFVYVPTEPSTLAHLDASGSPVSSRGNSLEIDDIDVDNTELESTQVHPVAETSSGNRFARRLSGAFKSLKGKQRSDEGDSNRMKLFDGKNEHRASKTQTVDDIRAKYGHARKSQEVSSVMEMARNKLAERGEKLQDISEKTSELENNAENFASMAEELAKRMAHKKWWEL